MFNVRNAMISSATIVVYILLAYCTIFDRQHIHSATNDHFDRINFDEIIAIRCICPTYTCWYAAQQRHIDTVEPCIWTTYTPHMDTRIPIIYRFYRRIVAEFQFWANANAGEQTKLSVTDTKKNAFPSKMIMNGYCYYRHCCATFVECQKLLWCECKRTTTTMTCVGAYDINGHVKFVWIVQIGGRICSTSLLAKCPIPYCGNDGTEKSARSNPK